MHCRITDIARKSFVELRALKEAGLTHLYPGTENGNDEALNLMNKGATVEDSLIQLKRLEEAGLEYTANYIFGLAGRGPRPRPAASRRPRCSTNLSLAGSPPLD